MLFEIPLWFVPPFYKIDLSEVPVLIGGFALGPMAGIGIECLKMLLYFFLRGTMTAGIGELANLLIGISYVLPSAAWYHNRKNKSVAVKQALFIGSILMIIFSAGLNVYILLPVYAKAFSISISELIQMGTRLHAGIKNMQTFLCLAVIPFNFVKAVITSMLVWLIYRRLESLIDTDNNKDEKRKF